MEFSFLISSGASVSQVVIAEAVAMYVGGSFLHHSSEIELSQVARYRIEPAGNCQWNIFGTSLTEDTDRLLLAHYLLMAGFFKAKFSVEYLGANASWLPEHGRLIFAGSPAQILVRLPRLFREHFDLNAGEVPLSSVALESLHEALISTDTIEGLSKFSAIRFASDRQMLVTFPEDVSVELLIANDRIVSHTICGFTLGGITAENGLRDHYPKQVRTWGEAWLAHDESKASILSGLLTLPNEVGVVTDRLYRYRIEEPESLRNRDRSQFGQGRSKVYDRVQWIQFAGKYFELRSETMLEACLIQAKQLSETEAHFSEMDRLRTEWKLFSLPSGLGKLVALEEIRDRCGITVYERVAAIEKSRLEAYEYSDYGRHAWSVSDVCYTESTPKNLMEAGFDIRVFELLTGQSSPPFLPPGIPKLFSFYADNRRVWGHDNTGRYFVEAVPNIVFGV